MCVLGYGKEILTTGIRLYEERCGTVTICDGLQIAAAALELQLQLNFESLTGTSHSASCKMNNSPFILRPCRRINYILGQIYVESYILIVSKSMQMVIIYQMQNSGRMYNSRQILIIFCPSAELNKN